MKPDNHHPRLLLSTVDVRKLRRGVRAGFGRKLLHALRRKVRPFIEQLRSDEKWVAVLHSQSFFWPKPEAAFMWALPDIALVGILDEDERAVDTVRRVFRALPSVRQPKGAGGLIDSKYYMPPLFVPYAYDLIACRLSDDERRAYVQWAVEHHIRLAIERSSPSYLKVAGMNLALGVMEQALMTLLAVRGEPGAPDLRGEQEVLVRWLEASLHVAIGPDGFPEEDIGYGTVVVPTLAQVAEAARRAGVYDSSRECPRIAQFGRAMLHLVQPWGEYLSNTGDHGDQLRDRQFVLGRQATQNRDPSLLWLLGTLTYAHSRTFPSEVVPSAELEIQLHPGFHVPVSWLSLVVLRDLLKKPVHPSKARIPTAYRDRGRGLVSFRSGWEPESVFVVFDGSQRSPGAPGHQHASAGHFSISALGDYFAIDTGRYNVEQNQHNVVLIEGKSGHTRHGDWVATPHAGVLTSYTPGEFCDVASADASHQSNCYWSRRHLGLVKGEMPYVWTVDDVNAADDFREFWWTLNTSPENTITIDGERASIRGWRRGNSLDVHLMLPAPTDFPKPHSLTWTQDENTTSSFKYVSDPRKSADAFPDPTSMLHGPVHVRPRLIGKVAGYNGRFLSLMIPRMKGRAPARVERLPSLQNSIAARITQGGIEDTIIWAYEHHLLEANGIRARGKWIVRRRSLKTGRVIAEAVG